MGCGSSLIPGGVEVPSGFHGLAGPGRAEEAPS